jgi:hypothetical protein
MNDVLELTLQKIAENKQQKGSLGTAALVGAGGAGGLLARRLRGESGIEAGKGLLRASK